ncbi:MAG: transglycosylase SLT domain-containing protein [Deltaproteobacteria bacterium]|nr:transglycosylase SLT domain-containing protein [Deltaproteobacteria bacterium]
MPIFEIPQDLTLSGEPVPLKNQYVYEMLDREFHLAVYDPAQVIMWLKRANRYFPIVEGALAETGLPDDLKYLAVAESSLKTYAYSSAGAAGMWQFIRTTGHRYGLKRTDHKDDRYDFERATKAALRYLKDLYDIFGSWPLAMAAYNCGEERVQREMKEQGVSSYYLLNLPLETERYIFRILAAKIVLSDPESYGYDPAKLRLYPPLESCRVSFTLKKTVHLRLIAEAAGTYYKEIRELNPSLRGRHLPPGVHWLLIPEAGADGFKERLEKELASAKPAPQKSKSTRRYVVKKGDTLSEVAEKLSTSVKRLVRLNKLNGSRITVGQVLLY